jgi:hypothetical protein
MIAAAAHIVAQVAASVSQIIAMIPTDLFPPLG